jgi:hypothetical protein
LQEAVRHELRLVSANPFDSKEQERGLERIAAIERYDSLLKKLAIAETVRLNLKRLLLQRFKSSL